MAQAETWRHFGFFFFIHPMYSSYQKVVFIHSLKWISNLSIFLLLSWHNSRTNHLPLLPRWLNQPPKGFKFTLHHFPHRMWTERCAGTCYSRQSGEHSEDKEPWKTPEQERDTDLSCWHLSSMEPWADGLLSLWSSGSSHVT